MIKLTQKQKNDIEIIKYFIPKSHKNAIITQEDIQEFVEFDCYGKQSSKYDPTRRKVDWYNALCEGKIWRGIFIWLYEEWVMDGSTPYYTLLKWMPIIVKDYIKKEMFKWVNSDKIDYIWQEANKKQSIKDILETIFFRIKNFKKLRKYWFKLKNFIYFK